MKKLHLSEDSISSSFQQGLAFLATPFKACLTVSNFSLSVYCEEIFQEVGQVSRSQLSEGPPTSTNINNELRAGHHGGADLGYLL